MAKYAVFFTYSSDAWARMINSPGDRTAAWVIAVATGQPSPLTAELAGQLQPAANATAEPLRGFAYAPALPDQATDDPAATLLRYLGRNPNWTP